MNTTLRVALTASPEQARSLGKLQTAFAEVCNALAPLVQQTRCWNRVTLHHLAYKQLRERYPQMGSQMVCNAIYSVSRTARVVFQSTASPFHLARLAGKPLPLLKFLNTSPVYFDRHTLSLKAGALSLYTLDGRIRFVLALTDSEEKNFHDKKLREIVLSRRADGVFELVFLFSETADEEGALAPAQAMQAKGQIPEYVKVEVQA
jgi:hypothetical protein